MANVDMPKSGRFVSLSKRSMLDAEVTCCRSEAEKFRRLAAKTVDPREKDALQRIADRWLKVAHASARNGGRIISIKDAAN
jgi:hypothetical protein